MPINLYIHMHIQTQSFDGGLSRIVCVSRYQKVGGRNMPHAAWRHAVDKLQMPVGGTEATRQLDSERCWAFLTMVAFPPYS